MLTWMHGTIRISVACDTMEFDFIPLSSVGVVHSTWPSRAMWHMHAPMASEEEE